MNIPALTVTDETLTVVDHGRFSGLYPDAHADLMQWTSDHGVSAEIIPGDAILRRHPKTHQFSTLVVVTPDDDPWPTIGAPTDDDPFGILKRRKVVQLDDGPAPWPASCIAAAKTEGGWS